MPSASPPKAVIYKINKISQAKRSRSIEAKTPAEVGKDLQDQQDLASEAQQEKKQAASRKRKIPPPKSEEIYKINKISQAKRSRR